jgi:predicted outer membrane protein
VLNCDQPETLTAHSRSGLRRHLQFTQKGAGFDSACIDHEVTVHETVFGLLSTIESNANNAQLEARAKNGDARDPIALDRSG